MQAPQTIIDIGSMRAPLKLWNN